MGTALHQRRTPLLGHVVAVLVGRVLLATCARQAFGAHLALVSPAYTCTSAEVIISSLSKQLLDVR